MFAVLDSVTVEVFESEMRGLRFCSPKEGNVLSQITEYWGNAKCVRSVLWWYPTTPDDSFRGESRHIFSFEAGEDSFEIAGEYSLDITP